MIKAFETHCNHLYITAKKSRLGYRWKARQWRGFPEKWGNLHGIGYVAPGTLVYAYTLFAWLDPQQLQRRD